MAVIRLSNPLRDHIKRRAFAMFSERTHKVQASFTMPFTGDEIYDIIFGQWEADMERLPAEFFRCFNTIKHGMVAGVSLPTTHQSLNLSKVRRIPFRLPQNYFAKVVSWADSNNQSSVEVYDPGEPGHPIMPLIVEARRWEQEVKSVIATRQEFVDGVVKVLEAHQTLNAAIKSWPALWDLLDEPLRERHRTVEKRVKTEAPVIATDLNKLTSAVVLNKIL
jgi:hypothetical protein